MAQPLNIALGDNALDLAEVEGLIRSGGTSGIGNRRGATGSYFDQCVASIAEPKNRRRWMTVAVVAALLLLLVFANSSSGTGAPVDDKATKDDNYIFVDPEETTSPPDSSSGGVEIIDIGGDNPQDVNTVQTNPPSAIVIITPPPTPAAEEPKPAPTDAPQDTKPDGEDKSSETSDPPKPKSGSKIPPMEPDIEAGPVPEEKRKDLAEKWGSWHFWDGDEDMRPKNDYLSNYPNKDIPGDDFPQDSWQTDAVYVNHYLNDADKLIDRAMEAIFAEYGHGKPLPPEEMANRMKMFHWEKMDLAKQDGPPSPFRKRGARDIGGWTTQRSFDGLVRRLLHAMMTQDTFTVVLAGHSAAQGQGNHFRQSYMMQFHRIMKPIFARLGVKLITRNMSQGGMGTVQNGMGAADIYGRDIDLFMWDCGMTEGGAPEHIDLVVRQVLLSGNRVPVIWGPPFELLRMFHEDADVDVGEWGNGYVGIPITMNETHSESLPWAARNIRCSSERQDLCNGNRYSSTCWINRTDGIVPSQGQPVRPKGQVKWHPGWRVHQLMGRVLAFSILEALEVAVNTWMEGTMTGQPLDDDYWHVTEYYDNIRNKVKNLDPSKGKCYEIAHQLPTRICTTPMKARTQFTPRADGSSLTDIIKPAPSGYVPHNDLKPLYEGPDAHNPAYDVPEGHVDVLSIVMGRRRKLSYEADQLQVAVEQKQQSLPASTRRSRRTRRLQEEIVPGEGWDIVTEPQGHCDGTYEAVCAHSAWEECFLIGHHDYRGAVVGCEWSGWLVMTLKALKEGIIVVKLHTWHWDRENPRTANWKSVNGKRRLGQYVNSTLPSSVEHVDNRVGDLAYPELELAPDSSSKDGRRHLMRSYDTPELPDTFYFDYAINGKITSLNKTEFLQEKKQVQRVVETLTLLDNPSFVKEEQDVEVAIRLRGVERKIVFGVSHIYWA